MREDLVTRRVDDDLILYDPVDDRVTLLNPSAAAVLGLCDGTRSVEDIVEAISTAHGVDVLEAREKVAGTLAEFRTNGLLR